MSDTEQAPSPAEESRPAWAETVPNSLPQCDDCEKEAPYEGKHVVDIGFYTTDDGLHVCKRHQWLRANPPSNEIPVQTFKPISMDQIKRQFYLKHTRDGQRKVADDTRKAKQSQELHDNLGELLRHIVELKIMSFDEIEQYTLLLESTPDPYRANVKNNFYREVEDRLNTRRDTRILEKTQTRGAILKDMRVSLLKAAVQKILSDSPQYREDRIQHELDMKLVADAGKFLDYMSNHLYDSDPTIRLFTEKPKEPGCPLCSGSAKELADRIEARKPKPKPFTPPAADDAQSKRARILWMGGASGVEEPPE